MTTHRNGVCTVCQSTVPITRSNIARQEERDRGWDDWEIDRTYGDNINFLVIEHESFGTHCEGSGQIPQFIDKP